MRIANKITLLIFSLFCILAVNTWMGLRQMNNIRTAFSTMVTYDIGLMESVTAFHESQMQKSVVLQRLIGVAEELGFESLSFARSSYLHDQLKDMKLEFGQLAQLGAKQNLRARELAGHALDVARDPDQKDQLREMLGGLERLDRARQGHNASMDHMLEAVEAGGFQLSLEDLEGIQRQENILSKDVGDLLRRVQNFVKAVLERTKAWEQSTQKELALSLWFAVLLGCFLAFWIVRSIVRPLNVLSNAARQIGQGNFKVNLSTTSNDELAQLSGAFNIMSQQLQEFKDRLEKRNEDLKNVNDELDKFIHIMGHDIVDPLTMMIAYCAYVEQHAGPTMDAKNLEALQGIRKASTKMHAMVKDLLKFSESKRV